jgi:hypothetical protein
MADIEMRYDSKLHGARSIPMKLFPNTAVTSGTLAPHNQQDNGRLRSTRTSSQSAYTCPVKLLLHKQVLSVEISLPPGS